MPSLSDVWTQPDFLKLWTGQAISQVGSRVSATAVPLTAVLFLRASPLQMGIMSGAGAVDVLLFGLFAGVWTDRLHRRPILIATDLGRMFLLGSIPLAAALHRLTMTQLYVVGALFGILTVLLDVAYQAYLPSLVNRDNLVQANSQLALTESIAEVVGPGMAGVFVDVLTAPITILLDAISFLVSAFSLTLIRTEEPLPKRSLDPHIVREITEGLQNCWRHPILRALALRTGTAAFFMGFFSSLYFLFAVRELGVSVAALGFIISIGGVSSVVGAFIAERVVRRFGFGRTFIGSALMSGVATVSIPLAHGPVAVACAFLIVAQLADLAWPVFNINEAALRQTITPDRLLGRVNSAMHLLFNGALPLGSMAGGALAEVTGVRTTLSIASIGLLLSTLWLVFSSVSQLREVPS